MKAKFSLMDDKTVVNETVRLGITFSGLVLDQTHEQLQQRARDVLAKLITAEDASWAFTRFQILERQYREFTVTATTRVNETATEGLNERIREANEADRNFNVTLSESDTSVPLFQMREADAALRASLLKMAEEQAEKLRPGSRVTRIVYNPQEMQVHPKGARASFSTANYALEAAGAAAAFGNSEKIIMTAEVTVDVATQEAEKIALHG